MEDLISYYPLIKSIATHFYNLDKEDLYQAGFLGLLKARNNYKDTTVKFSTYAFKYIYGEMYDLSLKSQNIKLNKQCLKVLKMINKSRVILEQKYMRSVSLDEIGDYLNIDVHELEYILMISDSMVCLDDVSEFIGNNQDETCIDEAINDLDPLSSEIMKYRLYEDMTQSEVAKKMGLSQVKVSRIESKSKQKLKEYIYE